MDEIKAKQQVVEKIKEAQKILVTVSDSPSVDALSAALALTMVLDKQEKYATSIFSGDTPPAIAFLEPQKTFDDTTDSLRDFIIALNKEKADHLRYKVEGDSVKIFITPYKTTIDQSDLEFSQGDYNVELVIALGVSDQDHLDKALEDHGKILHDATIVTITAGDQSSDLGGIDWHEAGASSLSEMIAGLSEALKEDKKKSLLDAPIATALLTGVVAETDRFSNEHTTSKAMTVAASLMAAGADQQLIATELQNAHEIENAPVKEEAPEEADDIEVEKDSADGTMTIKNHKEDPTSMEISHEGETLADLDRRVMGDKKAMEKVSDEVEAAQEAAAQEEALEDAAAMAKEVPIIPDAPAETHSSYAHIDDEPSIGPAVATEPHSAYVVEEPAVSSAYVSGDDVDEPTLGGTLNATTEQAADDARREEDGDKNRTILSHAYLGSTDASAQVSMTADAPATPGSQGVNDFSGAGQDDVHSAYAVDDQPALPPSEAHQNGAVGGERVIQPLSEQPAPAPVFAPEPAAPAYAPAPEPAPTSPPVGQTPADLGLPLPPPLPDFSQMNGAAPALPLPPTQQPAILGDILAPEPAAPAYAPAPEPAPTLPPVETFQSAPAPAPQQPMNSNDPTQFQIPPQQ